MTGLLSVVGLGPGDQLHRTAAAVRAVEGADEVHGYARYVEQCADLLRPEQRVVRGTMGGERERADAAVGAAAAGARVALVSTGDAGVYGMAGLALLAVDALAPAARPAVEVVAGVTAASAAAALLGAPLARDFACLTLSDALAPWDVVRARVRAVAAADLVLVLYNPRSAARSWQLGVVRDDLVALRGPDACVGVVTDVARPGQRVALSTLGSLDIGGVGMSSTVVVGSSTTARIGDHLVTARALPGVDGR